MNIDAMRTAIGDIYPRRGWRLKVRKMSDEQVLAIYKNMERSGRLYSHSASIFREAREATASPVKENDRREEQYEQLRMMLDGEYIN